MNDVDDGGTPASDVLEARIEPHRASAWQRWARRVGAIAVSAISGDGADLLPGYDVVVVRRDTDAEILRTRAGQLDDADRLLHLVREELASMTVVAFIRSWRPEDHPDGEPPTR